MKGPSYIPQLVGLLLPALILGEESTLPVVMWHGMGDFCTDPLGMTVLKSTIEKEIPGVYVKSLCFGNSPTKDAFNSFFLHTNIQVEQACEMIASDPKLKQGFNALGFSQGGQFLRAVAQRCPESKMRVLVTFGAQHQGVYGFPRCPYPSLFWCDYVRRILDVGAYWSWVQKVLVQAQYWKDPLHIDEYSQYSTFLADINNERPIKNASYARNLASLEKLVLVRFNNDTMVVPVDSEWFEFYKPGQGIEIEKLENSTIYKEDWIGLKELNKRGALHRLEVDGDHLQFTISWFITNIVHKYLAPNTGNT